MKLSIFSFFLIICFFSFLTMQCPTGLKVIKDISLKTEPSPIILTNSHLEFSYNIQIPDYWQVRKADSLVFVSSVFDNNYLGKEIDSLSYIPNPNDIIDGKYHFTHKINQEIEIERDSTTLAIQLFFYKNGHGGMPSEKFEVEYIIRSKEVK